MNEVWRAHWHCRAWEAASETGSTDFGREMADLEARTGLLSNYQPAAIPGLLQTPAYARRLLSSGPRGVPADLADRVMSRIERQRVLYGEGKRFRFVIPEGVLTRPHNVSEPEQVEMYRQGFANLLGGSLAANFCSVVSCWQALVVVVA